MGYNKGTMKKIIPTKAQDIHTRGKGKNRRRGGRTTRITGLPSREEEESQIERRRTVR